MARTLGLGTTIHWDSNTGTTWASLGDINECEIPEESREIVDVTALSDAAEEYEAGITKRDDFKFTLTDPDGDWFDAFQTSISTKQEASFKVTEAQATPKTFIFDALPYKVKRLPQKNNEPLRTQVTCKATSAITAS